jgi:predicted permease
MAMLKLIRRLRYLVRLRHVEADLREELEFHRAERQRQFEREGIPTSEAVHASRHALGNMTLAREDARGIWVGLAVERTWQDLRYGARALRHNAVFTIVAVLTLALGIAATVAMFSVINTILLRPLPYADPDRLAVVWTADPARNIHEGATSFLTLNDWRENHQFADLAFWREHAGNLTGDGEPERVVGALTSSNLFSLLGVAPQVGRTFSTEEDRQREPVVVLAYPLSQRRFGSPSSAIGHDLEIDGRRLHIIGVMPEGFYFPTKDVQHWEPASLMSSWSQKPAVADRSWGNRYAELWRVVVRLKRDANVAAAERQMNAIAARLAAAYPASDPDFIGYTTEIVPLLQQATGHDLQIALWILLSAVGMVLLIACANVSNLVLARGAARTRELGIRAALGAGRARLIHQLLIENGLIAIAAGVLGSLAATGAVRAIAASAPGIPRLDEIRVDGPVLASMVAVSLASGLLCGIIPAWRLSRGNTADVLKETGAGTPGGVTGARLRGALVVLECTLALMLLAGAGLLMRSLLLVRAVDAGFDTRSVLVARVNLPIPVSREWRREEWETFATLTDRIASLPGVRSAGAITNVIAVNHPEEAVTIEGRPGLAGRQSNLLINTEDVTPGFFEALGIPPLQGRLFTRQEQNRPIAIVNQSFANRFFPGENPIGKRFKEGGADAKAAWITIVGVVADMHRYGLERQPIPEFFFPSTEPTMDLAIRTTGDPMLAAPLVRDAIRSTYGAAIVLRMSSVDGMFGELSAQRKFQAWMMTLFAAAALALAAVGVYGIVHFVVAQRRHEFAVRIALGASGRDLFRLVLLGGMRLPALGVLAGLFGAFAMTRVIENLLFQVRPTDPATFFGAAALLLAVALVACWMPARRAARVDPLAVLRVE